MNVFLDYLPIIVVISFMLASWGRHEARKRVQPLRLELAGMGETMLRRTDVPDVIKDFVQLLLSSAFSLRGTMIGAVFVMPFLCIWVTLNPKVIEDEDRAIGSLKPTVSKQYAHLCTIHRKIVAANHPVLYALVQVEIWLFLGLAFSIRRLWSDTGRWSRRECDVLLKAVEVRKNHFRLAPGHP